MVYGVYWGWIGGPGGDLLSRALRHSTMGAGAFHGRVRDGIGCRRPAKATRSSNPSFSDRWVGDPRSVKGECGSGCCVCLCVVILSTGRWWPMLSWDDLLSGDDFHAWCWVLSSRSGD